MSRTIAAQPELFCAYYEGSASSDLRALELMKQLWTGTAAFLKGLVPVSR